MFLLSFYLDNFCVCNVHNYSNSNVHYVSSDKLEGFNIAWNIIQSRKLIYLANLKESRQSIMMILLIEWRYLSIIIVNMDVSVT